MKRRIFYILLIPILCLSSCGVIWDMTVSPFVEYKIEESDIKWYKFYPECDYFSYDIDTSMLCAFMYDEKYCTYRWRLKYNSAAPPIQTIMFDNKGDCVGGYEFCYGNAKMLDVYDEVPIFKKNVYNDTIFKIVRFENYIDLFDIDKDKKDEIIQSLDNYDYNMIIVWSYYGGYYMKRHLRQIKRYIKIHNNDNKFRVLYLKV